MRKIVYILSYLRYAVKILFKFCFTCHRRNRIVILATPTHGNLGDHAIVYAEKQALKAICPSHAIIEIENGAYLKCKKILKKCIRETDIVIIDGGGNLGTIWHWEDDKITDIILTYCRNKIVIFPQTVFYESSEAATERIKKNREVYARAKDLTVLLRDQPSFDFFAEHFPETKTALCPDIVLSLERKAPSVRNGVLLCLRSDRERVISEQDAARLEAFMREKGNEVSYTDTVIRKSVRKYNRHRELQKKWNEFSSAALVVTDRLHAMIFAYITETPCIAFNNSSKKVEGTYQFIQSCPYIKMAKNVTEAIALTGECMEDQGKGAARFVYPITVLAAALSPKSDS